MYLHVYIAYTLTYAV